MKMRLLTALIATACLSQAASADDLTSGSITNQTTATADVVFNQPVTLENTLTPVAGLKPGEQNVTIATGKLAVKESGVTARLALKTLEVDHSMSVVYAEDHQGDAAYRLSYQPLFDKTDTAKWDTITANDGYYMISPAGQTLLTYKVMVPGHTPGAGKYTISVTGAVYNP